MNAAGTVEDKVCAMISDLTAIPAGDVRLHHDLMVDLGFDSVTSLELLSMLSEDLDIEVELEETMDIKDVQGIVNLVKQRLPDA